MKVQKQYLFLTYMHRYGFAVEPIFFYIKFHNFKKFVVYERGYFPVLSESAVSAYFRYICSEQNMRLLLTHPTWIDKVSLGPNTRQCVYIKVYTRCLFFFCLLFYYQCVVREPWQRKRICHDLNTCCTYE